MKNMDHLRPSSEEAKRRGRLGGLKKGENHRYKQNFKSALDWYLDQRFEADSEEEKSLLEKFPSLTKREALAVAATGKAMQGDVRAMQLIRDTTEGPPKQSARHEGEKPFEINITTIE